MGASVPSRGRRSWVEQAGDLRHRRGQWRLLTWRRNWHTARTMVSEINRGRLLAFTPAGDFEAYGDRDTLAVYARYLGNGVPACDCNRSECPGWRAA